MCKLINRAEPNIAHMHHITDINNNSMSIGHQSNIYYTCYSLVSIITRTSWSKAGALCIPEGTHFLCEGRDSSFPSKFHKPSSSKGVM